MQIQLRLALAGCLCLSLGACRVAGERGFRLQDNFTELSDEGPLDDVIVWPVQQRGTSLTPELLERMTKRLHTGLRDQEYSVHSRAKIDHLAGQLGNDEGAALKVLEATKADGVLVFRITSWDERGLLNLGELRAEGQLKLIGPGGRVRWQTRVRCDDRLVPSIGAPRSLDERRKLVAERFVEHLAARLPRHRV